MRQRELFTRPLPWILRSRDNIKVPFLAQAQRKDPGPLSERRRIMNRYDYKDPRGRRSGPYIESELKSLAARGLLEADGVIELTGVGEVGRVADIPWLGDAIPLSPPGPPPPPPATAPPTSADDAIARAAFADAFDAVKKPVGIPRSMYVLLALLPPIIGLFGVHNIAAGYRVRGATAVLLSFLTFGGLCVIAFPPCACAAVPLWITLFGVSLFEAVLVRTDAAGKPFG